MKSKMINQNLTDWQRVQLAELEYHDWQPNQDVLLPDGKVIGSVIEIFSTDDGFRATVVQSLDEDEITVLFRGSSGFRKGDPTTWTNEWLRVNLPVSNAIINQVPDVPQELWTASKNFNQLLDKHPNATFYLYGHSLGSINAQFALANCHQPNQIGQAFLYEGPNLYWLLDKKQRQTATQLRGQILNYIDPLDVIAMGYIDMQHTIGLLKVVDSAMTSPINQHMWGGYQFDKHQRLLLKNEAWRSRRAIIHQQLITAVQQLNHDEDTKGE